MSENMPASGPVEATTQTDEVAQQQQTETIENQPEVQGAKSIDQKIGAKFAALSRKEKAIKQMEASVKQRESEFAKQLEEMKAENARLRQEFDGYKGRIKNEPFKVLGDEGLDFETLTKMKLNDDNPTPEMLIKRTEKELESKLLSKIEALEKQLAEKEERAAKEAEDRTVGQYKKTINDLIAANTEKYELISLNDAQDTVWEVIEQFYNSEGKILSPEEAADYVEKHLENEVNEKYLKAKKIAAKIGQPKAPEQSEKKESITLSNALSAEVPKGSSKVLSRDEEIAEAAKGLRWNV